MLFELESHNEIEAKILTSGTDKKHLKFTDAGLFEVLESVDLYTYRNKLENSQNKVVNFDYPVSYSVLLILLPTYLHAYRLYILPQCSFSCIF